MGRILVIGSGVLAILIAVAFVIAVTLGVGRIDPPEPSPTDQAGSGSAAAAGPTAISTPTATDPPTESQLRARAEDRFRFRLGPIDSVIVHPDATDFAARTTGDDQPLLLFLPATGHIPDQYVDYLSLAAKSGYHVLGLDFWNIGRSVAHTCEADPHCYLDLQRNRFDGNDPDRFSKVDAANSVLDRLDASLAYLAANDPRGGWGDYAPGGRVDWSRIVVSGHSQGGGEAAYIAHRFAVKAQLTFSSPLIVDQGIDASWIATPSATPPSRMWGFDDEHDVYYDRILPSWQKLGFGADPLRADVPVPPAGSSVHALISTRDIGTPAQTHLRSITDQTPLDADGRPVFRPVWAWMLARGLAAG